MTFLERYKLATTWHEKATVMEIYHLCMCQIERGWTLTMTARDFEVSIGLVSENLQLAHAIHVNEKILKCESRQSALLKIRRK